MARPIAKDHDDKRRLILTCAAKTFANQGFDRASMVQVARACGISKANIYHYYSSKDDILFDILDQHLSGLRDRICGLDLVAMSPESALRTTVTEILLAYQGADNEHRLQSNAIAYLPADRQTILAEYQRDLIRHMGAVINAIAPTVFANDKAKRRAATLSIFGMLNWFYMWNPNADEAAREDYGDLVCNFCLNGLPGV